MRTLKITSLVIFSLIVWTGFIAYGLINGFLLKAITSEDSSEAFVAAIEEEIDEQFVGNLAMTLIEKGKVANQYFYTIDEEEIDEFTVFQVASVSKWVTSWGVLKLVEDGEVDLDKPVDNYLSRWHLPESEFDNKEVTIRRLLSHTAGLVDGLGYEGFGPRETVQTIEESLTKAADGLYSDGVARVGYEPGTEYQYSGAGYTILQLLIEEVSGMSFQAYMTETIFEPLKMNHSTFVLADKPRLNLATLYKEDGTVSEPFVFTALAAASLYTCTADLSKFMIAHLEKNSVLSQEMLQQTSKPGAFYGNGMGRHGLGPMLYSQDDQTSKVIGHDGGSNRPVVNTTARVDLLSGDGIIVLEMGQYGLASSIADEWLFWRVGIADRVVIERNIPFLLTLLAMGYILIAILSILLIKKGKRKRSMMDKLK